MLGKLIAGVAVLWGGYKGFEWYGKHKAQMAVTAGHSYGVTVDYTGTPITAMTQAAVQALLDAAQPGHFDVVAVSPVPNAKQYGLTIVAAASGYLTGDQITTGWPTEYGSVSVDSFKDMGASGAGTAAAPLATT